MERLPFNPNQMAVTAIRSSKPSGDQKPPLTVSEVAELVGVALAENIPAPIHVVGEISNFMDRTHWFFSLKDEEATLRCVMFASSTRRPSPLRTAEFRPEDGQQVVGTGHLDFYGTQGHLQLYVDKLEPIGQGVLDLKFRQLCDELRQLGYFDPDRKQPLPMLSRCVAVVTSRSGAALQDVINTARKRWPGCRLLFFDVHVQGVNAASQISAAINALSADGEGLGIDTIILTRGGGSIEDLWTFNERAVADAIYRCRVPVVAAIGHETDTTIAELVADLRCATPTQATMQVVSDAAALHHQVRQTQQRLQIMVNRLIVHGRQRLDATRRHPVFRQPEQAIEPRRQQLIHLASRLASVQRDGMVQAQRQLSDDCLLLARIEPKGQLRLGQQRFHAAAARLAAAGTSSLRDGSDRLHSIGRQLESLGPSNVLRRGYTYTLGPSGRLLQSVRQPQHGDRITTVFTDGRLASTVEGPMSRPGHSNGDRRRRSPKQPNAEQFDLFG